MKNGFKTKMLFLLFTMVLSCIIIVPSVCADDFQTIKIGLCYGSGAKVSYNVKSGGGMSVFLAGDNNYVRLVTDMSVSSVTVKQNVFCSAELCETFDSAEAAIKKAEAMRGIGYDAFCSVSGPYFNVRIGTYSSYKDAEYIASRLEAYPVWNTSTGVLILKDSRVWLAVDDNSWAPEIVACTGNLSLDGTPYRGSLRFVRQAGNDMTAINILSMNEYLYSVVPKEMSPSWSTEALKAQAVAARTFAITNMNKFAKYGFNLDNTTNSQVYSGINAENPKTTEAVNATSGEVVLYDGKPAEIYYFTSSGGRTANSEDVWSAKLPYLRSVSDEYEDTKSAGSRWSVTYTADEIKQKLAKKGINIGEITDVKAEYTDYGYAVKLTFIGTNGSKEYKKDNITASLGLKSTNFTLLKAGETQISAVSSNGATVLKQPSDIYILSAFGKSVLNLQTPLTVISVSGESALQTQNTAMAGEYTFSGGGYGHCIGMSQWGAKGMAENGFTYKEILKHYYTGVQVEKY